MDIRNCKKCGRVFGYTGKHLCPDCLAREEEDFKMVKDYIYEHPKCSVSEVSEATGVAVRTIINFLKDDRLESVEGMSSLLTCEKCGVPINSGRYCEKCAKEMKRDIKKVLNEAENVKKTADDVTKLKTSSRIYIRDDGKK